MCLSGLLTYPDQGIVEFSERVRKLLNMDSYFFIYLVVTGLGCNMRPIKYTHIHNVVCMYVVV